MSPTLAATGAYGAQPFDRAQPYATALLADIQRELREVDFFTREDLLHLPCFRHVATITRYGHVREAVNLLMRQGKIVAKTRTDLCLPARSKYYGGGGASLVEVHSGHLLQIVHAVLEFLEPNESFGVMDVVDLWVSDPHLTTNAKRVAVRRYLPGLVAEGVLQRRGINQYAPAPKGLRHD